MEGKGGGFVVSCICLLSSSISITVLTSSVPVS